MLTTSKPFTKEEYIGFLKDLKTRTALHQSVTASAILPTLDEMIANMEADDQGDRAKEWKEKIAAARLGDIAAKAEVANIRILRTQNFLVAMSHWLMFFNQVSLADNATPYWQNDSKQETVAFYSGQDGGRTRSQVLKYRQQVQIMLQLISSEIMEYYLRDLNTGDIADETRNLVDIARDLAIKIDQKAKPFVTGACVSTFTTTGTKQGRTFMLHSVINANNIPAGNLIDVSSTGTNTSNGNFSKAAMDAVIQYCASWGDIFGEVLTPKSVLIPSKDSVNYLADVTFTSQNNPVSAQLLGKGYIQNYGGVDWNFIPDVTLDPTAGFAYVQLNKAIGEFYEKTGMAESEDVITPQSKQNNKGEMWQSRVIGFVAPLTWNPMVIRVKYK